MMSSHSQANMYKLTRPSEQTVRHAGLLLAGGPVQAYQWATVPKTVRQLEQNLTTSFADSTALLWGHRMGVVGGTGDTNSPCCSAWLDFMNSASCT